MIKAKMHEEQTRKTTIRQRGVGDIFLVKLGETYLVHAHSCHNNTLRFSLTSSFHIISGNVWLHLKKPKLAGPQVDLLRWTC